MKFKMQKRNFLFIQCLFACIYPRLEAPKPKPPTPINKDIPQPWVEKYKPKTIKDIIGQQGPNSNCSK